MSEIINICVAAVNEAGRAFYEYAAGMFLQTGVLVAVLLCVDRLLRNASGRRCDTGSGCSYL